MASDDHGCAIDRVANTAWKDCPITRAAKAIIVLFVAAAALGACHPRATAPGPASLATGEGRTDAGAYLAPPVLVRVTTEPAGRLRLTGLATAGARVRVAAPAGQPLYAQADGEGTWRMEAPRPPEPRLFGLAMIENGRVIQSEGYVLLTAEGPAALLRGGAGTVLLGGPTVAPVIDAVDYDAKGGAVVSGRAAARATLDLFVDGARQSQGRADGAGRYSLPLDEPQTFSDHTVEVADGGRRVRVRLPLTVAAPLVGGPWRAISTPMGWRIDWVTPGGGLQTTLLVGPKKGAI